MKNRKDSRKVRRCISMFRVAFLFSLLGFSAQALTYSNSLKFRVTQNRAQASDFANYARSTTGPSEIQVAEIKRLPAENPEPAATHKVSTQALSSPKISGHIPAKNVTRAQVFVVDDTSYLTGKLKPIEGAVISIISPAIIAETPLVTDSQGIAVLPYPLTESVRFFVSAEGFGLGMGYAVMGQVSVVPLVAEGRISTLVKSLALRTGPGQISIFGRLMNSHLNGIAGSKVVLKRSPGKVIYSGSLFQGIPGYFTRTFQQTDGQGSFVIESASRTRQLLEVANAASSIPAFQFDLTGIPDSIRFVSLGLVTGPSKNLNTTVVDGDTFERPECGIKALVAGQPNVFVPEEDGSMWVESKQRSDLIDLKVQACKSYLPTYLTQMGSDQIFPPTVGIFRNSDVRSMLAAVHFSWSKDETLVLGHIYPQKDFKHPEIKEVEVSILGADGKVPNAEIVYFDSENQANLKQTTTDPHHQNFLVRGLDEGEYHFLYRDPFTDTKFGMQVVRVRHGGVTQVDF